MMKICQDGTSLDNSESWHDEHSSWNSNRVRPKLHQADVQFKTIADVGWRAGQTLRKRSDQYGSVLYSGCEDSPDVNAIFKQLQTPRLHLHLILLAACAATEYFQFVIKKAAPARLRDCDGTVLNAFYSFSMVDLGKPGTPCRLQKLPRRLGFAAVPDLAVPVLGYVSLIGVAR